MLSKIIKYSKWLSGVFLFCSQVFGIEIDILTVSAYFCIINTELFDFKLQVFKIFTKLIVFGIFQEPL